MYAIVFDFDTTVLEQTCPNQSWRNACAEVRNDLTPRGFAWQQGSMYFGDQSVDAVRCVTVVQKMVKQFPWFTPSARDVRMLRIEENNDLRVALDFDAD